MNNDKGSTSKESTPRNEQDDISGRQLKSLSQSEGPETWSNAESSVGSSSRRRPSSWDDSDDELPIIAINSFNHNGLIYSEGFQKQAKFVTAKIDDIKTQYFKNLDAVEGLSELRNSNLEAKTCKDVENTRKIRSKLDTNDRRQSPARIRRRTKSSGCSSAILEPTVECNSSQSRQNFQSLTHETYQYKATRHQSYSSENPSLKAELEFDSNYFLDHIFTELRTKKIGLFSIGEESSLGKGSREGKMLDLKSCSGSSMKLLKSHDLVRTFPSPTYNPDLKTLESFESEKPVAFIHKTSRKLSQILEVEETKKSRERINLLEEEGGVQLFEMSPFLWANPQKPPDDMTSSFLTSKVGEENTLCWTSIISLRENSESPTLETAQVSPKTSGTWKEIREEDIPKDHTKEKLSKKFYNLLPYSDSDNDNIIFLTEKTGKTQLSSNSEKQEGNNCGSPKDSEKVKHLDGIERETSWEILEIENLNSESEKVDVGENPGLMGKNNSSGAQQKNLSHIKTPNTEVEKNSQEGKISNLSEETMLSWSEGSTPKKSSRHSLIKSSKREREPDFRLEIEGSNLQPQRLTSRSLKIEQVTPAHSSRESSFRLKDEYISSTSGETSKRSSQRMCDNLTPERAEDKPNFLNINLEKVCSDSSASTESNSSSSRTFTQEEIKDSSFRTNSSNRSAESSHTSESPKNRSSKKIKTHFCNSSNPNELRMKGSKTERHSKSQNMSSLSLRSLETMSLSRDFGNIEKKTECLVNDALKIREKPTLAYSERISKTVAKGKTSKTETRPLSRNSTYNCNSTVSECTGGRLAQPKDVTGNLKSTIIFRQRENYDDVTITVENIIPEKINSSRSEKTSTKWKNDKRLGTNEEGVKRGLCETRSEETMRGENFQRNLLSIQTKDVNQEDSKSCKKDDGIERNTVTSQESLSLLLENVKAIEESETFSGEKSSLSPSSTKAIYKELTIPTENISCSLEKIEIDSDKSVRENEGAETEGNQESNRSRKTGRLSNESSSITSEKWEKKTLKEKLFSGQTSNRTAISNVSSEAAEKHMSNDISQPGSYKYTRTEGSQTLNEKRKSTNSKTSFQESLGHETSKEPMASKPIFHDEFNEETWNQLIDAFEGTQTLDHSSENKFPGFPSPNQKEFTEHDREETQDFFLYELDNLNESEDLFMLSRRLIKAEGQSCLRSPKDREHRGRKYGTLVPESISLPREHSEGRIIIKSYEEKSVHEHDSKRRNFEIGEFGDGNCWQDGKPDISEPEKPQHHGDGNQEGRNNWKTLVLRLEDNKEEKKTKSTRHTWMEVEGKASFPPGNEKIADSEPIFISQNLNHSKSENSLSKMWSQQRENFKTSTNTGPMKGNTKKESNKDSISNSKKGDRSEESFSEKREYPLGRCYSNDENRLIYGKNSEKNFERLDIVTSKMGKRKQEKESTNLSIFLARHRKENALIKANNWLIIKNQEGKQSKEQKQKIRKLKKKLKKCKKLNSSKESIYIGENATEKMPAFVPTLKFSNTGCLQNFYKRLFSICCLTSDSSAATSL